MSAGFPNLLTIVGPHNASTRCNIPRCIEQNVDWVTGLLRHMQATGMTRAEATPEAEAEWSRAYRGAGRRACSIPRSIPGRPASTRNVEGKTVRRILQYQGGAPQYRARCDAVAEQGYAGMTLD